MNEPHAGAFSPERLRGLSLAQIKELQKQSTNRRNRTRVPALVREECRSTLPLSYAQERLWFLDQLGLVGAAYNIAVTLKLNGELNLEALESSFTELICRHESLRTRFRSVAGSPIQAIEPTAAFVLNVLDLSGLPESDQEPTVHRLSCEEADLTFDLAKGPLLRASLLRLAEQKHVLLLTMHHIACDGWSLGILQRELGVLYGARASGLPSPLPEPALQYADYAVWQRRWLQGEVLKDQLHYWSERLSGAPPQLQLPTDRPRPAVESFRGAKLGFKLPAPLSEALKEIARREQATPFMVFLAAYNVLLSRWSAQQDVVVGSPVAGRRNPEVEGLVGSFINTLALRANVSEDLTFRQLLAQIKEVTLGAYTHQDLPFEALVKELRPERDLTRQPVFQVVLALQNYPEEKLELPGLTWAWADVENASTHFDLTLHLDENADGFSGVFEYASDLFDSATIERMAGHFRTLLDGLVTDPDCRICHLPLLGQAEQDLLLVKWNATAAAYPHDKLIHELIEEQVARTPQATAVECGGLSLTYAELNRRANQLAQHLRNKGVGPDQPVGICVERSLEMVVGLLGILKAGGAYLPLDPSYPPERLAYMLKDAAPKVLLIQERLRQGLPATAADVLALDNYWDANAESTTRNLNPRTRSPHPNHLAYVIYTSGSTGQPKGVMVSHRNVLNLVQWHCAEFNLGERSRSSGVAAVGFDAAAWEIWPPLTVGATLVLASPEISSSAESLLSWWASQSLDVSFLPTPMAELAFSRNIHNKNLKTLLVGGDRLRYRSASGSAALINNYGPTESTVVATSGGIRDEDAVLHIGRPIANTQIYILDRWGQVAPIGVVGEIHIGGAGVARGYLNLPEQTSQRFIHDPFGLDPQACLYKTGDLGRWQANGTIEYVGRNDDQVKIRGYRIELGEIEAQLARHEQVSEVAVILREDVPGEKRLVAYITHRELRSLNALELRTHLKSVLPEHMVPSAFVSLESMPLTPNGKLDRRALPAPQLGAYATERYEAPQGETEEALARIWQELLAIERIGRQDNFFELGGHSLQGLKLVARIAEQFRVHMSAIAVFRHPTVQQMATVVESLRSVDGEPLNYKATDFEQGVF